MLTVEALEDRCLPSASIVFEWTNLLLNVSGPFDPDGTGPIAPRNQNNAVVSRSMAMMEAAIYDAVNAIDHSHTSYHVDAMTFPGASTASAEAAAAQAAHDVAVGLYNRPAEVTLFDQLLAAHLGEVADGPAEEAGIALGQFVAAHILAWRANDGSGAVVPYTIGTDPGDWQPTPPAFNKTPAVTQWPFVTPFAMTSGDQFRPGPPPALTDADYTEAFLEIKPLGGNGTTTPSTRTPEQTEIAIFWAGIGVSNAGVAIWNQIAQTVATAQGNTLAKNARLFALLNVTIADAFIAGMDAKYVYNYWRPVTAIRAADTDGNPDTSPDPTWTPLIVTPNHPSYVALHASQSESAAQALASFFGDQVDFTATWAGVQRSFHKFTEAAHEAGVSRIYGGIHWSFDIGAGKHLGRSLGRYVADNFFRAVNATPLPLLASSVGPGVRETLTVAQVTSLLPEALARWQATGVDANRLSGIDIHIGDLGGATLGQAVGHTVWLDDNAAGWGWFVDPTPWDDSEFTKPGNPLTLPSPQNGRGDALQRMDLLTALAHEIGHLLGYEHEQEGVMIDTLAIGIRRTPGGTTVVDWSAILDALVSEPLRKRSR